MEEQSRVGSFRQRWTCKLEGAKRRIRSNLGHYCRVYSTMTGAMPHQTRPYSFADWGNDNNNPFWFADTLEAAERASITLAYARKVFCEPELQVALESALKVWWWRNYGTRLGDASSGGEISCKNCHWNKGQQTAAAAAIGPWQLTDIWWNRVFELDNGVLFIGLNAQCSNTNKYNDCSSWKKAYRNIESDTFVPSEIIFRYMGGFFQQCGGQ